MKLLFIYAYRNIFINFKLNIFSIIITVSGLALSVYMYAFISLMFPSSLPIPGGDKWVVINQSFSQNSLEETLTKQKDALYLQDNLQSIDKLNYYHAEAVSLNQEASQSYRYVAVYSDSSFLRATKITPILGRYLYAGEENSVVIAYNLWSKVFNNKKNIIGQSIIINGQKKQIIGVMPKNFAFPYNHQIWLTLPKNIKNNENQEVFIVAKINKTSNVNTLNRELSRLKYTNKENISFNSIKLVDSFMGEDTSKIFNTMLIAIGIFLLMIVINIIIISSNNISLLQKDISIFSAIGVSKFNFWIITTIENIIFYTVSGIMAAGIAIGGINITRTTILSFIPGDAPFWWNTDLTNMIILSTFKLIAVILLIVSLVLMWKIFRVKMLENLRNVSNTSSKKTSKIQFIMIVFQMTIVLVICGITWLYALNVYNGLNSDYGIKNRNFNTARVTIDKNSSYQNIHKAYKNLVSTQNIGLLTSLPGEFTLPRSIQIQNQNSSISFTQEYVFSPYHVNDISVYPGSIKKIGIEPIKGRMLSVNDDINNKKVVVITQSFVDMFFFNENPIGKKIKWKNTQQWYVIVGVVPHIINGRPFGFQKDIPTVYSSILQIDEPKFNNSVVAITSNMNNNFQEKLTRVLEKHSLNFAVDRVKTYKKILHRNTAGLSFIAKFFYIFCFVSLILIICGIYATITYWLISKEKELNIRYAIGYTKTELFIFTTKQNFYQILLAIVISSPVFITLVKVMNISNVTFIQTIYVYGLFCLLLFFIVYLTSYISFVNFYKKILKNNF